MTFSLNQIVLGHKAGVFVILGFRTINGEQWAQLKSYDPSTGRVALGELSLPLNCLRNYS